jgi:hypothetical protein
MQLVYKQTAVSEQRLGKQVPAETDTHTTIEEWCFRCGPCQGITKKTTGAIQSIQGLQLIEAD